MEDAFARSVTEVLEFFQVDPTKGLTDSQVTQNSRVYGRNVLPREGSTPFWKLVLKQFEDLLVKILIAAALVSFILALIDGETGLTAFLEPSLEMTTMEKRRRMGASRWAFSETCYLNYWASDVFTYLLDNLTSFHHHPGDEDKRIWVDCAKGVFLVILMILAANAAVGVITETNAEKALED
ncbi:hypothetical protein GIB67_018923 [Kingdonia uniflora]|uniref:Cation-transporting P-type ATPase N-terminal domain-containing protein n=1 Tax=Kingdonia uniflora TaxID=39325 RepID=A0A7J7L2V6_9MAGN|nr:hypothetical protein GIB67_018923 [Kingdonia uniflora]